MAPKRKKEEPVTRRFSRNPNARKKSTTSPDAHKEASSSKKPKIGSKNAKPADGKGKRAAKQVEEDEIEEEAASDHVTTRTIIIEACTQCKSFKERADKVKRGLESAISDISVEINPQKPRRGYFEIREEKTEVILSLPSMERPFTLMKQLDLDEVINDLIKRCE